VPQATGPTAGGLFRWGWPCADRGQENDPMQKLLLAIDRLSTFMGQAFAWLIVLLTLGISWEVFGRYVLNNPHDWSLNAQIMLYGTLFMMAGAYTLSKGGHVRGDVLYGFFRPRTQATIDLVLYIVFFLPGIVALTWAGWSYANESLAIREKTFSATPLPLYPFKFVIPLAGGLLLLQGLVEIVRCVICLRQGDWPSREHDVEEVDLDKLKEMVHVKDSDIESLDKYVVAQEKAHGGAR
jgi:TRAP-type mannitol/chloroaromatic compound transport system permease small subunit